jgi:branched-chain amino acid transport system ATP-binding protein
LQKADDILTLNDVSYAFGGVVAVDGCSLRVPRGSITGLIGPNGAGKTTLVNLVCGALKPSTGQIIFDGDNIAGLPSHQVARRGLVRTFQLSREFASLTVLENLLVAAPLQPGENILNAIARPWIGAREDRRLLVRALELLEILDLERVADDRAANLSGGQKRLLELGRVVMAEPKLVMFDEPMAGVSPVLIEKLIGYLSRLRNLGISFVLVEHNLNVVDRICEYVIVMAEGKTLATGTMASLRTHDEVIRAYLGGAQTERISC